MLLAEVAAKCDVSKNDLYFVEYKSPAELAPSQEGSLQPGFTHFNKGMPYSPNYFVDDNGMIECPSTSDSEEPAPSGPAPVLMTGGLADELMSLFTNQSVPDPMLYCATVEKETRTYGSVGSVPVRVCRDGASNIVVTLILHGAEVLPADVAAAIDPVAVTANGITFAGPDADLDLKLASAWAQTIG